MTALAMPGTTATTRGAGKTCAVVLLSIAIAGCTRQRDESVRIDPALATLIPAGANVLAGVRVDEVRQTALYQKWLVANPLSELDDLTRETGIDARKDLWEVLIASGPAGSVALARGKFADQGLEPRLQREGVKRTAYKGYTLIGDEERVLTFMNPGTAVAGRPEMVRAVIDQRNSPNPASAQALLEKAMAIPRGTQIWMVTTGGLGGRELPKTGNLANLGNLSGMIESATAAMNLGAGVKANVNAWCRTDADAKKLNDTVRGLVGMARLLTPANQPDLLKVYDAIQFEQKERTVHIAADLPQPLVETLIAKFGSR